MLFTGLARLNLLIVVSILGLSLGADSVHAQSRRGKKAPAQAQAPAYQEQFPQQQAPAGYEQQPMQPVPVQPVQPLQPMQPVQPIQPQPQPQFQPMPQPPMQQPPMQQPPMQQGGYYQQPPPQGYPGGYVQPGYPQQPGYAPPPEPMLTSVDGLIQLGLSVPIVQYASKSQTFKGMAAEINPATGIATMMMPEQKVSSSETNWGFATNSVALEGGYGLSDHLLIGGLLQLGGKSQSYQTEGLPEVKNSSFSFLLGPKIDYMFSPTSKLNPFVGAAVAVAINSTNAGDAIKESSTTFNFVARGGIRYFLFEQLSLDPTFQIGAAVGSGTQTTTPTGGQPGVTSTDKDFSQSGIQVALSLGVSLWLK
jgi:hypothetical protein